MPTPRVPELAAIGLDPATYRPLRTEARGREATSRWQLIAVVDQLLQERQELREALPEQPHSVEPWGQREGEL